MTIRVLGMAGVCALALCVAAGAVPKRAKPLKCADPDEVTAMQTTAIQQQLMVAAQSCGPTALTNYNAFQTHFQRDLMASDKLMLTMFYRIMGRSKGDKAYNLFKTELAAKAELVRTHNSHEYCEEANLVAAAALGPTKITLRDFVADVPAKDLTSGVNNCSVEVGVTMQGVKAGPNIVPTPNPLRMAKLAVPPASSAPAETSAH